MSDPLASANLGLPFLAAAQAQKHVTHNEALRRLDAVVQLAVLDSSIADPPDDAEEGDRYIVADDATGDWEGGEGKVAAFVDGAWMLFDPSPGWVAYERAAEALLVRVDDGWTPVGTFLGTITRLGINATADDTNRLAVRAASVLLSAIEAADGGSGDLRLTLNKEADGDTASLLFQRGWSGRAEIGLAGDTDLVFKVSPDGSVWTEALRIDKDTGLATILYDNASSGLSATNVQDALDEIATGAGGSVTSVFGRTGTVAAALHDYDASQVDNDSGVSGATVKDALDGLAPAIAAKQAGDSDLTAIAGLSTTGLIARTGAGTASVRTLTAPAAGIGVSNGDGVSGNPTLALADDLAALEGLSGTGIAKRTGTDAWAIGAGVADLAATTADRLFGSDGSGNAGIVTMPAAGLALSAGVLALANDLAAYEGLSATGLVVRTADGAAAARTLTAPAAGVSVSNGSGVSGNPTLALANDLAALEGLSSTGLAVRSATDTWVQRSVAASTGLSVSNGSGASGNPTVALDVSALVEDTSPDSTGDFWLTYDSSATAHKKVRPTALVRERLAADRTYYVRTDGSDSNGGLANSSGGAFLTIQKAYDVVASTLDLAGRTVTIQIGDGTYAPASGTNPLLVAQSWSGGGSVVIQGNATTPANVVLSGTNADAVLVTTTLPGVLAVKDLKVTTATGKSGIQLNAAGSLTFTNLNFGACVIAHVLAACTGALITGTGNYTVSGGAQNHAYALTGSIVLTGLTVTLSGTPAFGTAFANGSRTGVLRSPSMTFTGSATGPRYSADANGVVFTSAGGASYFPGNSAGSTATGGQYI